jgi:Integron cassette protein VCH_CASS1 chain
MAISATNIAALHTYAQGVMSRAMHHAGNVDAIALPLLGAIVWRADPNSISHGTNVLWWESAATHGCYACSYNRGTSEIEIRAGSTQGAALHSFSNATPVASIQQIFSTL